MESNLVRLPPSIFRVIAAYFTAPIIMHVSKASKNTYNWLFASEEGSNFIKEVLARELDLPHSSQDIRKFEYADLLGVFLTTFKRFRP